MPRIVVVCACLLEACFFDADYKGGRILCGDGKCPSGLTCAAGVCTSEVPDDGMVTDVPSDVPTDGLPAALTCVQPGVLATTGGTVSGSTAGRSSLVSATCEGSIMNGNDAVYRIDAVVGAQIGVSISGSYPVNAYVLAPCSAAPATPTCLSNMAAASGDPISVTTSFAGQHFIVVDGINPAQSGTYSLTVTVN